MRPPNYVERTEVLLDCAGLAADLVVAIGIGLLVAALVVMLSSSPF